MFSYPRTVVSREGSNQPERPVFKVPIALINAVNSFMDVIYGRETQVHGGNRLLPRGVEWPTIEAQLWILTGKMRASETPAQTAEEIAEEMGLDAVSSPTLQEGTVMLPYASVILKPSTNNAEWVNTTSAKNPGNEFLIAITVIYLLEIVDLYLSHSAS